MVTKSKVIATTTPIFDPEPAITDHGIQLLLALGAVLPVVSLFFLFAAVGAFLFGITIIVRVSARISKGS